MLKMKSQGKQLLKIVLAIKGGRDLHARLSVKNGQREQKGINLRNQLERHSHTSLVVREES